MLRIPLSVNLLDIAIYSTTLTDCSFLFSIMYKISQSCNCEESLIIYQYMSVTIVNGVCYSLTYIKLHVIFHQANYSIQIMCNLTMHLNTFTHYSNIKQLLFNRKRIRCKTVIYVSVFRWRPANHCDG